ncbi:hypothetical protein BKH41_08095 [Helicobacter sp. 12S02232-10]|uniref:conjugal transfer protein TraF n=1 Tax=Helicobacter sp. 12S02232-10 TaxID=1476197 RepID=UPI000BA4E8B7|nr:conjugal transfer protein TraF [Helicobacter sp. 12S02232-10]PAF47232.1 hypothetical protein BKH41_08095 [Helicobacter sp. 12S02232-10]
MKKIFFVAGILSVLNLEALEFGGIGNVSAGMGGAGVALKASPYGLYYNPALLSADNKTKFGYSIGVEYRQKNIDKLANLNLANIASSPKDMETLQDVLKDNNLSITSQNGIVFQLSSSVIREEFGSIALGFFGSMYSSISLNADPNRMGLIVENGGNYYKLVSNVSGGYTPQATTQTDYEQHSIVYALQQGDAHKIVASSFVLSEIPIGYAKTFYFKNSNLNLGIAAKYMNGINAKQDVYLSDHINLSNELKKFSGGGNYQLSSTFGIDLGMMYEIDLPKFRYLTFGVVAKNINSPTFKYTSGNIVVKPQYRVGIAYNERYFTVAFDADILPNELLNFNYEKQKSQMLGGGVKFDLKYFDLRAGAMMDIRQNDGLILTGGINVLGLFDIALQSGTKLGEAKGYKIPKYLNLKIGGSFSF